MVEPARNPREYEDLPAISRNTPLRAPNLGMLIGDGSAMRNTTTTDGAGMQVTYTNGVSGTACYTAAALGLDS